MNILITNDDGIHAPGINHLKQALESIADVTIVAPDTEKSAVGHAITLSDPLRVFEVEKESKFFGYAVNGTPADCIKISYWALLDEKPDMIISGINLGSNTGINVIYSGTVSAATEGTILEIPSFAVSLTTYSEPHFGYAARFAARLAGKVLQHGLPRGTYLNVNVPNVPEKEIEDVVVARQRDPAGGSGDEGGFRLVRLKDIGSVVDGYAERESIARYNGHESVGVLVFKESGANTVQVAESVNEVLDQLREEYPAYQLDVASSQAGFIADSISNVVQALVFGGILAFLVLFLFLRDPRYPVAIALAIPISVVGTFALMEAAGISLNIMSLGGWPWGWGCWWTTPSWFWRTSSGTGRRWEKVPSSQQGRAPRRSSAPSPPPP